jgi:hypothetical protein
MAALNAVSACTSASILCLCLSSPKAIRKSSKLIAFEPPGDGRLEIHSPNRWVLIAMS